MMIGFIESYDGRFTRTFIGVGISRAAVETAIAESLENHGFNERQINNMLTRLSVTDMGEKLHGFTHMLMRKGE